MASTDIYPTQPSSYAGNFAIDNPTVQWSVGGDNNPSTCVGTASDSKFIYINIYETNNPGAHNPFYSFGLGSIPTYVTITSLTAWWYENRSGTNAGSWKGQHAIGGAYSDNIASHAVNSNTWVSGSMARPGGGSWTRADLANLQFRASTTAYSTSSRNCYIDQLLVRVVWDYISLTSLTTNDATSVTTTSATISGSYNANGDGGTEWRMVYGTSSGSYDSPAWTANAGTGSITAPTRNLTGLTGGTTYYYRLEARNSADTAQYGAEKTFTTAAGTKGSRMMMMG
jgi:hypothetical protein